MSKPFPRPSGRCGLQLLLPVLLLATLPESRCHGDELPPADTAPLVVLAPNGPVLAQLRISVDRQPYRLWVTRFLADRLDVNNDGQLSLPELKLIPDRILQQSSVSSATDLLTAARSDTDTDAIALPQFTTWLADDLSRSFNVIAAAVQASAAVRLAGHIDADGDGCVSQAEVEAGVHVMRFRDLDDDQTFSAAELLPYRDPRIQQAAIVPDAADLPFIQLTDDAAVRRAAERILQRYGDGNSIAAERFRLPAASSLADVERVDIESCLQFLRAPVFHIRVDIRLSDRTNASLLDFELTESAADFCRVEPGRRGRAKLIIDDMPIDVRARGGGVKTRSFLVSFLLQRFSLYDKDRNGYLTTEEFPEMQTQLQQQGINAQFATADLNSDEMLLRDELKMFIERDAIATQSRIEVSVRQDGKTLFRLLDANVDRRLTERELLEGFAKLQPYDVNSDGRLSESELGTAYALEIGLGQVDSLRLDSMMQNNNMGMAATNAVLPGLDGLTGPEWFRRMDRNQDHDVSAREFLGPPHLFEQFDTDHDGLLNAAEAEALQSSAAP